MSAYIQDNIKRKMTKKKVKGKIVGGVVNGPGAKVGRGPSNKSKASKINKIKAALKKMPKKKKFSFWRR